MNPILKESLLNIARTMMQHILDSTSAVAVNHRRIKELTESMERQRQTYYAAQHLLSAECETAIPDLSDELDEIPF